MPRASTYHHEIVHSDGASPDPRWSVFGEGKIPGTVPQPLGEAGNPPLRATRRRLIVPDGAFMDLRMAPALMERTRKQCQADALDDIILSLVLSGDGGGWFNGSDQTTRLGGDLLRIKDDSRPYRLQWFGGESRTLHLEIPRANFDRRTLDRILASAGQQVPAHGLAPVLSARLRAFAEAAPELDPPAGAAGLQAALVLATTMLRLEFGSDRPDSEICEDGMLIAAQALIRRHFASLDLSPEKIAHRLGCSRAHLYRVFARHGLTVAAICAKSGWNNAAPPWPSPGPGKSIGDIAFRCGFDNPVYFAHLFYRRFSIRPSDARAAFQSQPRLGGRAPDGNGQSLSHERSPAFPGP